MFIKTAKQAYEYAYKYGLTFPRDWYITANFTWNEAFTNEQESDGIPIYEVFLNVVRMADYLQDIREHLKKPMYIHCWVRQIPHNKRVGSTAKYSGHLNGLAVDFHVKDMTDEQVRQAILKMKTHVRIEADTVGWVHVDINNYIQNYRAGIFYT